MVSVLLAASLQGCRANHGIDVPFNPTAAHRQLKAGDLYVTLVPLFLLDGGLLRGDYHGKMRSQALPAVFLDDSPYWVGHHALVAALPIGTRLVLHEIWINPEVDWWEKTSQLSFVCRDPPFASLPQFLVDSSPGRIGPVPADPHYTAEGQMLPRPNQMRRVGPQPEPPVWRWGPMDVSEKDDPRVGTIWNGTNASSENTGG